MTTKHTPTPWRVDGEQCDDIHAECGAFVCVALDCEYEIIAGRVHDAPDSATSGANAAFIVRAVNNHEALVEMVRRMCNASEDDVGWETPLTEEARALLDALGIDPE